MRIRTLAATICLLGTPVLGWAQMISTQMPLQHTGSSFYEASNIGWSVHNPHYFMNFNGGAVAPPFGGYQPNTGLHGGFGVGNAQFGFGFSQGASITSTSVTPMLTTTDGYPGSIFIGTQRPFVTGVTPIVGGGFANSAPVGPLAAKVANGQLRLDRGRIAGPALDADGIPPAPLPAPAPLKRDLAARPVVRPADGQPSQATDPKSTLRDITPAQYLERASAAEKEGRAGVARIYYQLAAAKGDPLIKAEASRKLKSLNDSPAPSF